MTTDAPLPAPRRHPLLYQVNTRVFLRELGATLGRPATLDDVPDAFLDEVADRGFDWLWWLGVWRTGPAARAVSRARADWRAAFQRDLPDLVDDDITGSPFAGKNLQHVTDLGLGLWYTGRRDLAAGAQFLVRRFAVAPDTQVSWGTKLAMLGLRYYW